MPTAHLFPPQQYSTAVADFKNRTICTPVSSARSAGTAGLDFRQAQRTLSSPFKKASTRPVVGQYTKPPYKISASRCLSVISPPTLSIFLALRSPFLRLPSHRVRCSVRRRRAVPFLLIASAVRVRHERGNSHPPRENQRMM